MRKMATAFETRNECLRASKLFDRQRLAARGSSADSPTALFGKHEFSL